MHGCLHTLPPSHLPDFALTGDRMPLLCVAKEIWYPAAASTNFHLLNANLPSNEAFHPYLLTYKDLIGIGYKFSNELNLPIFPLLKARIALRFATKSPEHERQCTIANA